MIIKLLLDMIYGLFNVLTIVIKLPSFPDETMEYINTFIEYLSMGAGIMANYMPWQLMILFFGIILAVDAGLLIYKFVMWIIKKIPMAGIS